MKEKKIGRKPKEVRQEEGEKQVVCGGRHLPGGHVHVEVCRHALQPRANRWRCDIGHIPKKNVGREMGLGGREAEWIRYRRKEQAMYTLSHTANAIIGHPQRRKWKRKGMVIDNYIYIVYIYRPVFLSRSLLCFYVHHRQCVYVEKKKKKTRRHRRFTIVPGAPRIHICTIAHHFVFLSFSHTYTHVIARRTYTHARSHVQAVLCTQAKKKKKRKFQWLDRGTEHNTVLEWGNSCFSLLFFPLLALSYYKHTFISPGM